MCGYVCIGVIDFMLASRKPTDLTSMFSPCNFEKNDDLILNYSKANEIDKRNLTDQTKYRLNGITKI